MIASEKINVSLARWMSETGIPERSAFRAMSIARYLTFEEASQCASRSEATEIARQRARQPDDDEDAGQAAPVPVTQPRRQPQPEVDEDADWHTVSYVADLEDLLSGIADLLFQMRPDDLTRFKEAVIQEAGLTEIITETIKHLKGLLPDGVNWQQEGF